MAHKVFIIGNNKFCLWGVSLIERLERQFRSLEVYNLHYDSDTVCDGTSTLIINGDYVFDTQLLSEFLTNDKSFLVGPDDKVAAIIVSGNKVREWSRLLGSNKSALPSNAVIKYTSSLSNYNDHLRKNEPPLLARISAKNILEIESKLYGNSYKGITDCVTKWLWPAPAKKMVQVLANKHISPNTVTLFSLLLVISSCIFFAKGQFFIGLLGGWLMTFLDTVDGKLARVTITSSKFGHLLDHGTDIVHPPIWYACWANGLLLTAQIDYATAAILNLLIIWPYIFGRLVEALFHLLGSCSIFAWQPIDAFYRLFTARRNPCLILLSVALICRVPELGLIAVSGWTLLSSFILGVRLMQAIFVRIKNGPLESWLKNEDCAMSNNPVAYKMFANTKKAYD